MSNVGPVGGGARGGLLTVGEGTREIQAFLISQVRNVGLNTYKAVIP